MLSKWLLPLIIATATLLSLGEMAVAEQKNEHKQLGKKLYRRHCVHCHGGQLQRFSKLDQQTFNKFKAE